MINLIKRVNEKYSDFQPPSQGRKLKKKVKIKNKELQIEKGFS